MLKIIKLWVPVVIWAWFIFYLSSKPGLRFLCINHSWIYPLKAFAFKHPYADFILRKIAHVLEYFNLTFLLVRAFKGSFNLNKFYLFIYPAALSLLYGVSDEIHKLSIHDRHPCIRNLLIDCIGIFGFYIFFKIFFTRTEEDVSTATLK